MVREDVYLHLTLEETEVCEYTKSQSFKMSELELLSRLFNLHITRTQHLVGT